jgi:two-component system, NtrC family, sensor kinase
MDGFNEMLAQIQARDAALQTARDNLEKRVEERTQELESIHKQLVEASRRGGMAEIATNVLHNVGNVLNSVNISTGLIVER